MRPEPGVHYAINSQLRWDAVARTGTDRSWGLTGLRIHAEYSPGKVTYDVFNSQLDQGRNEPRRTLDIGQL